MPVTCPECNEKQAAVGIVDCAKRFCNPCRKKLQLKARDSDERQFYTRWPRWVSGRYLGRGETDSKPWRIPLPAEDDGWVMKKNFAKFRRYPSRGHTIPLAGLAPGLTRAGAAQITVVLGVGRGHRRGRIGHPARAAPRARRGECAGPEPGARRGDRGGR